MDDSLRSVVERFLGTAIRPVAHLAGGDEAEVFHVEGDDGAFIVHRSPSWRTRAELEWAHAVARWARRRVPEAVAPIERAGRGIVECRGSCVAVFPFVDGTALNRDDPRQRVEAARVLANIHRALRDWPGGQRPSAHGDGDRPEPPPDPPSLVDRDLDAWWASALEVPLVTSATHGDYYRRNLLCAGGRIVGVIDWHDALVRPLLWELAGATFELCRDDAHQLHLERAEAFVRAYRTAGGLVPDRELPLLLGTMRQWIRADARSSLAADPSDAGGYAAKQIRAFRELASVDWQPER